jgi:hypothetical protein
MNINTAVTGPVDIPAANLEIALIRDHPGTQYSVPDVLKFVEKTIEWTRYFRLRTSTVFAQMMHETGWLRFTGDVQFGQHNFGGIGATGGGVVGAVNPGIEYGIIQVCVHHLAYIYGEPRNFPNPEWASFVSYDPRFKAVLDAGYGGVVSLWSDYTNGRWAYTNSIPVGSLANGYAQSVVDIAGYLHEIETGSVLPQDLTQLIIDRITARGITPHDIRDQMVTHDTKTYTVMPNDAWIYTGVHYTAVERGIRDLQGDIDSWVGHSDYHVNTRGWPGIAYAIGFSQSGRVFILRDINLKGFHGFTANANTLGIAGDLGEDNVPTSELLRSLQTVLLALHEDSPEFTSLVGHSGTYGHDELDFIDSRNNTNCPGPLQDAITQYRDTGRIIDTGGRALYFEETGQSIAHGFLTEWETQRAGIRPHGFPLTGEYDSEIHGQRIQYFERARFEWNPGGGEWEVQQGHTGRQVYELELLWSHMDNMTLADIKRNIERIVNQEW